MHFRLVHTQMLTLLLIASCGLLSVSRLSAQSFDYGNAWYDPSIDYLEFKVAHDGIYRASAQQISSAGWDTTAIDPGRLHLLYRGVEQYIHIDTTSNGQWNYLEFFGRRNDGGLDTLLYINAYNNRSDGSLHPNPNISTFSDTSAYFLYVDNLPGLRLQNSLLASVPPPLLLEDYLRTSLIEYEPNNGANFIARGASQYDIFIALNPEWIFGEGYAGGQISPASDFILQIPTPHALGSSPANLHLRLESMDSWRQIYEIYLNNQLLLLDTISGLKVWERDLACPFPMLGDTQALRIHVTTLAGNTNDRHYLNVAAITYPASTDLDGDATAIVPVNNGTDVYYKFRHIAVGNLAVGYDLVHHVRYADTIHGDSLGIWIAGQNSQGLVYLSSDAAIGSPLIQVGPTSTLSNTTNAANMVLITSRELATSAVAYQSYRQGSTGNPLTVKIVYTDEVYNEFGNGSPHPLAIKRFAKYALDQWAVKPDYFLIWGTGKVDIRAGGVNHVPAYGEPVSDNLYVSSFLRDTVAAPIQLEAAIGRIPISTNQEGLDYIDKLSVHETIAAATWMRDGLFMTFAYDTTEYQPIRNYQAEYEQRFEGAPFLGRVQNYGWLDSVQVDSAARTLTSIVNDGVGFINYFGHFMGDIHLDDPINYSNQGRFPVMLMQGPSANDFGRDTLSFGEKWVLEPEKGAIAIIGYTSVSYLTPVGNWGELFSHTAFVDQPGNSLGEWMTYTADSMSGIWPDQVYRNHIYCMNILGDPSTHLRVGAFDVWPGDANDDRIVNNQDLLSIGIAYNDTGALRPNASLNWIGQPATPWAGGILGSSNSAHADCNGDGIVVASDTLAITTNYSQTHNKMAGLLGGGGNDPELAIESVIDSVPDSSYVHLWVRLGSQQHPADSVYGLAWSVFYDPQLVDSASVQVDFDSCWVGQQGVNLLTLVRHMHALGRIDLAFTRIDHQSVSGEGIVARIGIVVIDNISGKQPGDKTISPLPWTPAEATMIDRHGKDLPLQGVGKTLFVVGEVPEPALPVGQAMAIFPNPAAAEVYVQTRSDSPCEVAVYDLSARLLMLRQFPAAARKNLDLGDLAPGAYLLKVTNADGSFQQKVVKID